MKEFTEVSLRGTAPGKLGVLNAKDVFDLAIKAVGTRAPGESVNAAVSDAITEAFRLDRILCEAMEVDGWKRDQVSERCSDLPATLVKELAGSIRGSLERIDSLRPIQTPVSLRDDEAQG